MRSRKQGLDRFAFVEQLVRTPLVIGRLQVIDPDGVVNALGDIGRGHRVVGGVFSIPIGGAVRMSTPDAATG